MRHDLCDLSVERSGNPDNVLRLERTQSAPIDHHRTTLDGIDPYRRPFHRRRRWLQLGKLPGAYSQHAGNQDEVNRHPDPLLLRDAFTFNIHRNPIPLEGHAMFQLRAPPDDTQKTGVMGTLALTARNSLSDHGTPMSEKTG